MLYSWNFLDVKDRGQLWYIIILSIVIGLVLWGFFTAQYGMSFIILLLTGITFYVENNSEDELKVEISELGIKINTFFYDYSKINSYTFIYEGKNAILLRLIMQKKGIKIIDLKIDNTVALELKQLLPQFIKENEQEDLGIIDKAIRIVKL